MLKGSKMTEEAKKKISDKMKAIRLVSNPWKSGQTYEERFGIEKGSILREKRAKAMKERPNLIVPENPWNKGLKGVQIAWNKNKELSQEHRISLSKAKGGKGEPSRGFDWKKMRLLALKRDGHKCQRCGKEAPQVRVIVHHKDPYKIGKSNSLDILITLCRSCHMIVEPFYLYRKDIVRTAQKCAEQDRNILAPSENLG